MQIPGENPFYFVNIKLLHFCMEYIHCHNGKGYDKIKKNLLTYEQGVEKWYLNQKIWIIA